MKLENKKIGQHFVPIQIPKPYIGALPLSLTPAAFYLNKNNRNRDAKHTKKRYEAKNSKLQVPFIPASEGGSSLIRLRRRGRERRK